MQSNFILNQFHKISDFIFKNSISKHLIFIVAGALTCTFVSPLNWWWFLFAGLIFFAHKVIYALSYEDKVSADKIYDIKVERRRKFTQGLLFGYGYYLFLFHWLAVPLFVGGIDRYFLLLPALWILLPTVLGLHFGLSAYAAALVENRFLKCLVAGIAWGILEYIRLLLIPFYPMSFVLLNSVKFAQVFYYLSPAVISAILFQIIIFSYFIFRGKSWKFIIAGSSLIMIFSVLLNMFLALPEKEKIEERKVIAKRKVIIIQPNISQAVKNSAEHIDQAIEELYIQTRAVAEKHKDALIIWPEASVPFRVDLPFFHSYESMSADQIDKMMSFRQNTDTDSKTIQAHAVQRQIMKIQIMKMHYGMKLVQRIFAGDRMLIGLDADFIRGLFGGLFTDKEDSNSFQGGLLMGINTFDLGDDQAYSSTVLFQATDQKQSNNHKQNAVEVQQIYDKINLIPFGEYVPMRKWLPNWSFIKAMAATIGDYKAGKSSPIHYWKGKRVAVLICYEGLFDIPYTALDCEQGVDKCQLDGIMHISNDAWFGESFCLYQDLDHARVKAIKYNCKVVRCLNTGISAEIDRYGRVLQSLPIGKNGVLECYI